MHHFSSRFLSLNLYFFSLTAITHSRPKKLCPRSSSSLHTCYHKYKYHYFISNIITVTFSLFNFLFLFLIQTLNFTEPFYAPPVVLVTAKRSTKINNSLQSGSQCNAFTTWVEVSYAFYY